MTIKAVPPSKGDGTQEDHRDAMQNGVLTKHSGRGGYKTIGGAEQTDDAGQKADLVRSYPRQERRQDAQRTRRGGK